MEDLTVQSNKKMLQKVLTLYDEVNIIAYIYKYITSMYFHLKRCIEKCKYVIMLLFEEHRKDSCDIGKEF
jgi:hypothetical protein